MGHEQDRRGFLRAWAAALASLPVLGLVGCRDPNRPEESDNWLNLLDAENAARGRLNPAEFLKDWGGQQAEALFDLNRSGFEAYMLRPRVLVDVSNLDLSTELLGQNFDSPILVGPTSYGTLSSATELKVLQGATTANVSMILNGSVIRRPADAAGIVNRHPFWYQLDRGSRGEERMAEINRALEAGASTIVHAPAPEEWGRASLDSLLDAIANRATVPVVSNGVMSGAQARQAVEAGAAAVIVSNRYAPGSRGSTLEALADVSATIGGSHPVLLDGGVRGGVDAIKALALGARAVLVGRPVGWAVTHSGAPGVRKILEILESDLALAMALCGRPDLGAIDGSLTRSWLE